MVNVKFEKSKQLKKYAINPKKGYPLLKAEEMIDDMNQNMVFIGKKEAMPIEIADGDDKDAFSIKKSIVLGEKQEPFNIIAHIQSFSSLLPKSQQASYDKLMEHSILEYYQQKNQEAEAEDLTEPEVKEPVEDKTTFSSETKEEKVEVEREEETDFFDVLDQVQETVPLPQPKKKRTPVKYKTLTPSKSNKKWKGWRVLLIFLLLVLIVGGIFGYRYYKLHSISLDQYLEKEDFKTALEVYPKDKDKIERSIFFLGEEGLSPLRAYVQDNPDDQQAQFDLAYLEKNYAKVIDQKASADTDGRKAQLLLAYLEMGQVEQADKINDIIQDPDMDQLIQNVYLRTAEQALVDGDSDKAKKINKKLKSTELSKIITSYDKVKKDVNDASLDLEEAESEDAIQDAQDRVDKANENLDKITKALKKVLSQSTIKTLNS